MVSRTIKQGFLAVVILTASSGAISKEISYNFIQGTYISTSVDSGTTSGDVDGDGLFIDGSFGIAPHIALTAGYGGRSFDTFLGIDVDTTSLTFGVTAHTSVANGTSIFGNFSVLKAEIEVSDGFTTVDDDDTGNIITVGLRHMATEAVELDLDFSRTDVFDDTDNTIGFRARFYVNQQFSLGIGYETSSDIDTLLLNARFDI